MERDVAVANFYFGTPTTLGMRVDTHISLMIGISEYERKMNMTWMGFLSMIGDVLDSALGSAFCLLLS